MMIKYLVYFAVTFAVFMAIDLIWLGVVAKNLYQEYLGYIMAKEVNWAAAVIFYVIFIIGALYFVIVPALGSGDVTRLVISAMLYGFVTYATYDLTNLATLADWPLKITVIDLIWGTSLSTLTSVISYFILWRLF
ncbi:MAG: hypothetical protein AVO33_08160 [delta proteobacterium ML8_F1]|nr:MAG: hypothetical protein AVO33_08160 [delta proteobacterium ML8_F1]